MNGPRVEALQTRELGEFVHTKTCCGIVAPTFDAITSKENRANKAGFDSSRRHTSNHDQGLVKQARERGIDVDGAVAVSA